MRFLYGSIVLCLYLFAASCSRGPEFTEYDPPSGAVQELLPPDVLAGAPVRAVWLKETADGTDWKGETSDLILMGYDSEDGLGVRVLHEGRPNYNKPLLTPDGRQVVFSDMETDEIFLLDWGRDTPVKLGPGHALEVWESPEGETWVYASSEPLGDRGNFMEGIKRFRIETPEQREPVIDRPVARDNFQLDRKGNRAAALSPEPEGGMFIMEDEEWLSYGRGCWASISPDDRGLLWIFDGRHRNVRVFDTYSEDRWDVLVSQGPGMEGERSYYPRWSNHSRFIVLSGLMQRNNYGRAEIYIGRFAPDFRSIEAWARLTDDGQGDFFPDLWIGAPDSGKGEGGELDSEGRSPASADAEVPEYEVTGRLVAKTSTPTMAEIAPYKQALAVYQYEVEAHPETGEPGTIYVAHWVLKEGDILPASRLDKDDVVELRLEPYSQNPAYEGERVVSEMNEGGATLFVATES